jgi:hypothetical protein
MRHLLIAAPVAILAALLCAPAVAQKAVLTDAAKSVIATGTWEFSNADRDKSCTLTFKADRAATGYRLEFDPKCTDDFPLLRDIAGWDYPDNDLLHLLDARGKSLVDFSEVETGMFEAPTAGLGVLFLQNSADAGSQPIPLEQVVGDWALMRGAGKPLCTISLSITPADEGFALTLKPGCDVAVARLNFARWRIDRDELMIVPARGSPWRFEQTDANTWERVPESSNPYTLVRQ